MRKDKGEEKWKVKGEKNGEEVIVKEKRKMTSDKCKEIERFGRKGD